MVAAGAVLPSRATFKRAKSFRLSESRLCLPRSDWLYNEFSEMRAPLESATLAREWLMQMGTAAARHAITVQYCMAWPRHIMQSVELQAVTQARASDDYHPGSDQWRVGLTSMLKPFPAALRTR